MKLLRETKKLFCREVRFKKGKKMSQSFDDNSIIKSLKTERLNGPDFTNAQKEQLAKIIQGKVAQHPRESSKIQNGVSHHFLIAALLVICAGVIPFFLGNSQTTNNPLGEAEPVQTNNDSHAKVFQEMVEKWDPDVLGGVASQFFSTKANPLVSFNNEIEALNSVRTDILSSFYAEFQPLASTEQN